MLIAQYALRARRTVAIYTAPWLLSQIRSTYEQGAEHTYVGLMERLAAVDLLQLDDMAVASQTDWTLEQLYTIVNRRYEDRRSVVLTADVESPRSSGSTSATAPRRACSRSASRSRSSAPTTASRSELPRERPDRRSVQDVAVGREARPMAGAVPAPVA